MTQNTRLIGISILVATIVAGGQLAFAKPPQDVRPGENVTTATQTPATAKRPGTGVVAPPSLQRIEALTDEECEGLGGVVSDDRSCKTGRTCTTTSRSGVVRNSCITVK